MNRIKIRNRLGSVPAIRFEPGVSDSLGDNVAIAFATYFSDHPERPSDDPPDEDSGSWGQWVVEKTNDALDRMAEVLVEADHPLNE